MGRNQIQKFIATQEAFQCPLCGGNMYVSNSSMYCKRGHCFDISSKGYINFLPNQKPQKGYNHNFFESRRKILEEGLYSHILTEIQTIISSSNNLHLIVDAGCGEGYYAKNIREKTGKDVIAFDFSKEAVHIAATGGNHVGWLISDISKIPLKNDSVDCLLNIFTPANYSEFKRVLSNDGMILKVIPSENHMKELRHSVRDYLRNETYTNQQVVDYFLEHFDLKKRISLSKTFPVKKSQLHDLFQMTPLLFGIDTQSLINCTISEITIEAEILIGKPTVLV